MWPLGLVPKKVEGAFRLIQHLSYTKDFSLTKENNGISFDDTSASHATVKDATGKVCMLVKIVFDVKTAFRLIPIRPEDNDQAGIYWQDLYYYDRCMPIGFSSSCRTSEIFSTAHEWIALNKLHIRCILHLVDDFLIISPSHESCQHQLNTFLMLCSHLGIPIAPEKAFGPSTTSGFAGIKMDTVLVESQLP